MEVKIIERIFDIHCHVLPLIDDGSSSFDMAINTLRTAYNNGTRNIICSSHSWGNTKKYYENFKKLKKEIKKENININLYTGCEIECDSFHIDDVINKLDAGEIFTINNTNYVLVEFHPYEYKEDIIFCAAKLIASGYKPIIAHMERYFNLMEDDKIIEFMSNNGVLFQINTYSLQAEENIEIKNFARKLLEKELVSFVGSDAHKTNHRSYMIVSGIDYIINNCNSEYAKEICYKNAERMFNVN